MTPEYDPETFKEKFPSIFQEIENGVNTLDVDGVRTKSEDDEEESKKGKAPEPSTVDYIRLCDEEEEALEIIDYMEEEGKIDSEYAEDLRDQLDSRGLSSFGPKREPGEYSFKEEEQEEEESE